MIIVFWRYDPDFSWAKEAYRDSEHDHAIALFEEHRAKDYDVDLILLDHDAGDGELLDLVVLAEHRRTKETN